MNLLREKRKELNLSQIETARLCGVSRRTYQTYEEANINNNTYKELLDTLNELGIVDFSNIILSKKQIKNISSEIFSKYPEVRCAYLFGSYARGEANKNSDIDFLVVLKKQMGIEFFAIAAELEEKLNKKIDLITSNQLIKNELLMKEVLSDGIKIY